MHLEGRCDRIQTLIMWASIQLVVAVAGFWTRDSAQGDKEHQRSDGENRFTGCFMNAIEICILSQLDILSKGIGKPVEALEKDINRPKYFNPWEAVEYGLIDQVHQTYDMILHNSFLNFACGFAGSRWPCPRSLNCKVACAEIRGFHTAFHLCLPSLRMRVSATSTFALCGVYEMSRLIWCALLRLTDEGNSYRHP